MAAPLIFQSLGTRVAILACFWAALLASIPSWLRLTTIQRLPLPTRQVEALQQSGSCPVTFQARLSVLVEPALLPQDDAEGHSADAFLEQVEQLIQQSLEIKAGLPAAASLECTRWNVYAQSTEAVDEAASVESEAASYAVLVLSEASGPNDDDSIPTVYLPVLDEPASLPLVPDTVSAAVIAELLQLRGDKASASADEGSTAAIADTEQDPRVIQYSKHVRLVFSIMNQDTADGGAYDSSLIHALANLNANADDPITKLTRELSGLHDFHVETQVQWFAPLHFQPTQEILEEIVEGEVEEEVMVDKEIEEEVEEEVEVDDEDERTLTGSGADDADSEAEPSETSLEENERDESEVEEQLRSTPPKAKRAKMITVKRKRIIQVPELRRVTKQTRTRLPPRHVVEWDDLRVFVNSEEWSLTSTVPPTSSANDSSLGRPYDVLSQTHDLHFLLYIPSKSHSPLLIRDTVTSGVNEASNAWLIPQWGGVVILNVDDGRNVSSSLIDPSLKSEKSQINDLPREDVQQAISLFAYQLEILLGLGDVRLPARSLHRRVQLSMLKQRRILELARESTSALLAITRLVSRIENLGVGPDVTADTNAALTILNSLSEDLGLDDMLARVKEAHALSNRAFFNPDMLGLLYFPDEHKYAVYTPLFAPLLVPLLVTTVKLAKELVGRKNVKPKGRRAPWRA